jgi:hypothetical protein
MAFSGAPYVGESETADLLPYKGRFYPARKNTPIGTFKNQSHALIDQIGLRNRPLIHRDTREVAL